MVFKAESMGEVTKGGTSTEDQGRRTEPRTPLLNSPTGPHARATCTVVSPPVEEEWSTESQSSLCTGITGPFIKTQKVEQRVRFCIYNKAGGDAAAFRSHTEQQDPDRIPQGCASASPAGLVTPVILAGG